MRIIELSELGNIEEVYGYHNHVPRRLPSLTGFLKHDASTEKQKLKFFLMPWFESTIPKYEILAISSYVGRQRRILMIDLSGIFSKVKASSPEVVFFQDWCVWQDGMSMVNGGSFAADDSVHLLSRHIFALLLLSLKLLFSNERNLDEFKRNDFQSLSELLDFIISKNDAESIKRRLSLLSLLRLLRSTLTKNARQDEVQKAQMRELINFFETNEDWLDQLTKEEAVAGSAEDGSAVLSPQESVFNREQAVVASGGDAVVEDVSLATPTLATAGKKERRIRTARNVVVETDGVAIFPAEGAAAIDLTLADWAVDAMPAVPVPSTMLVAPVTVASGGANDVPWMWLKGLVNVDTYVYSSTQLQRPSFPLLTEILKHELPSCHKEELKYLFIKDRDGIDTLQSGILVISFYAGSSERKRKMWVVDLSGLFFRTVLLRSQRPGELEGLIRSGDVVFFKDWCFLSGPIGSKLQISGDASSLFSQNVFLLLLFSLYLIFPGNQVGVLNLRDFKRSAKNIGSLSDLLYFIIPRLQNSQDIMKVLLYIAKGLTEDGAPRQSSQEQNSVDAKNFFDDNPLFLRDLILENTISCSGSGDFDLSSDAGDEDEGESPAKRSRSNMDGAANNLCAFFPAPSLPPLGQVVVLPLPPFPTVGAEQWQEEEINRGEVNMFSGPK